MTTDATVRESDTEPDTTPAATVVDDDSPRRRMIFEVVEVRSVERVSPAFVRLELGGDCLADFGVPGDRVLDQRIKLVFPDARGHVLDPDAVGDDWWGYLQSRPEDERCAVRTYTVRDVRGTGVDTRLVVDVVLHDDHSGDGTGLGPGARWAGAAQVGDRVVLLAPRRGHVFGGIEFDPGDARRLVIVGDETAVPAVHGILRDLPDDAVGAAFLEVPATADILDDVRGPAGVEVVWLPRNGAPRGERVHAAVLDHLGVPAAGPLEVGEVDPDLWETPVYSSSGEPLASVSTLVEDDLAGIYAWIAGESATVTALRRHLVKERGVDRRHVAFMGYWREGVAMRS